MAGEIKLWDFIKPSIANRQRQSEALDRARSLMALRDSQQQSAATTMVDAGDGFTATLPGVQRTGVDDLDLYAALREAGVPAAGAGSFGDFRDEELARQVLGDELPRLAPGSQRIEAIQKRDSSPVRMQGGVAFNRFNQDDPLIAQTGAVDALEEQRTAAAGKAEAETILANARTGAVNQATAFKRAAGPSTRIKAKVGGKFGYFDSYVGPDGKIAYRPALGPDGAQLEATSGESGPTAFERNTQYASTVLGISPKEVLAQARKSGVTPSLVRDVEQELLSFKTPNSAKYKADPALLRQAIEERIKIYKELSGGSGYDLEEEDPDTLGGEEDDGELVEPVVSPAPTAAAPAAPAAQPRPQATNNAAAVLAQARSAIARGAPRGAVEQRLRSLGIDPSQLGQ